MICFACINSGPCCGMNDDVRVLTLYGTSHRRSIGDVKLVAGQTAHFVMRDHCCVDEFTTKLSGRTRNENLHGLALSGSHHQRLSRYHATVASSASSSERSRFQPNCVILAMSTE